MRKRSGLKKLFVCMILTGVLAAVIVFSPLFLISDIQVNELVHYSDKNIREEAGLETGENALRFIGGSLEHLLAFRMGKAEAQVESLPWVKSADIRYQIPGTVHVTITEREAIAWVRYMSEYLLIDEEGCVLEVSSALNGDYPEIRGIRLSKYTRGKKIETEKPEKLDWLVSLLKSLELVDDGPYQRLGEALDWVDFLQDRELFLSLDGRITAKVKLNDELTYRLSYLKELYYNYIKPEERGMIDFFDQKYARFIAE